MTLKECSVRKVKTELQSQIFKELGNVKIQAPSVTLNLDEYSSFLQAQIIQWSDSKYRCGTYHGFMLIPIISHIQIPLQAGFMEAICKRAQQNHCFACCNFSQLPNKPYTSWRFVWGFLTFLSLSQMWTLCWKPHCCEADRGSWASLPETNCVRVRMGSAWGRIGYAWQLSCFLSTPVTLLRPCYKCPFPFWNGHTTDTVLNRGLDIKSFCFPVYTHKIVHLFVLWKHFVPPLIVFILPKVILTKPAYFPSAWACEKERRRRASKIKIPADLHGNSALLPIGINQLCSRVNQFIICSMLSAYY